MLLTVCHDLVGRHWRSHTGVGSVFQEHLQTNYAPSLEYLIEGYTEIQTLIRIKKYTNYKIRRKPSVNLFFLGFSMTELTKGGLDLSRI